MSEFWVEVGVTQQELDAKGFPWCDVGCIGTSVLSWLLL